MTRERRGRPELDGSGRGRPWTGAEQRIQAMGRWRSSKAMAASIGSLSKTRQRERELRTGKGKKAESEKGSTRVLLVLRQWRASDGRTEARAVLLPLHGRGQGRETARRPCSGMSRGAREAAKGTGLGAPRVLCSGEVVGMVEEELLSFGFERGREEETPGQEAARDRVEALVGPVKKMREVGGAADGSGKIPRKRGEDWRRPVRGFGGWDNVPRF